MSHTPAAYTTPERLTLAAEASFLLQISDDDMDESADTGILQWGADSANSFLEGYLAINPGIPIESITPVLRYFADVIAIKMIASRPPRVAPQNVIDTYDDVVEQLKAIVEGDYSIGEDDVESTGANNVLMANYDEDDAVFSREWLESNFPRRGHGVNGR